MFEVNDVVVYGAQGVCQIVGNEEKKIDGAVKQYFVLKPKDDRVATFYVPTWNEKALAKMRKVMTKEDVNALIDSMPHKNPTWIANENERKDAYQKIQDAVAKYEDYEAPATGQKASNYIEELQQLKQLLDMGIITEDEFNIKKRMLLGL